MHFTFGSPWYFLLLPLAVCFFLCRKEGRRYYFPKPEWAGRQHPFLTSQIWLKVLIFALLVTALAAPFVYTDKGSQTKKGRNLVLALDASGSMAQSGFDTKDRFKTKYDTTLSLAKAFIKSRHDDNMGIVIFGTFAYSASPLTYDLDALSQMLEMTNVGIAGESTAIGDALWQAMRTLSFGEAKHKVIILLTDGYHNAGTHSPKEAVAEAAKRGIRIYTIGIGKQSDYDASLLETIAKTTGGKSYGAANAEDLKAVFDDIAALEPSPIRSENYLGKRLLILWPLLIAMGLLVWLIFKEEEDA